MDRRIEILQQSGDTDESIETISNPRSPLRAFMLMMGEEDDGIFLEDSLVGGRCLVEERKRETNLEAI